MRPRVVMLAPYADGEDVGESWSSYQWIRAAAGFCDLTVLTSHRAGHRPLQEQLPDVRVVAWNDVRLPQRFERFHSMLKPGYPLFYLHARRWLKRSLRAGESWDLLHQVAPIAPRYPSPAARLGVPWILGPLAGGLPDPRGFEAELRGGPAFVRLRELDRWRLAHDQLLRATFSDASLILGAAPYIREILADIEVARFAVEPETGILELPQNEREAGQSGGALRLLAVARLVRAKGLVYALRALSQLPRHLEWSLDVLGQGEERAAYEALARRLGLEGRVHFRGQVPRADVGGFYRRADVLLFPSLREPSGNAVYEAMSHGLPVIACDSGGPGYVVDESSGIRVPLHGPESLVHNLADAIRLLVVDREHARELGRGARRRIARLARWKDKASRLRSLYTDVVNRHERSHCAHPSRP